MITELIKFRIFNPPCCRSLICWISPRFPNYCPECGVRIYPGIKDPKYIHIYDENAQLKISNYSNFRFKEKS